MRGVALALADSLAAAWLGGADLGDTLVDLGLLAAPTPFVLAPGRAGGAVVRVMQVGDLPKSPVLLTVHAAWDLLVHRRLPRVPAHAWPALVAGFVLQVHPRPRVAVA
eukprot:gene6233-7095_t